MNMLGLGLFDGLLIFAAAIFVFWGLRKTGAASFRLAALSLLAVLALHLLAAGLRWQILPAYLALFLTIMSYKAQKRWIRFSVALPVVLLLGLSVLASWAFPLFKVPAPTGDYGVGSGTVFLTDSNREEAYTDTEGDYRQLALKVWYPSENTTSSAKAPYWKEALLRSKAVTNGTPLPWFFFTHLAGVKSHSVPGAAIADGQFPVVLYSHGLGIGWSSGNMPLVEELASQGYIVIAIGHSYIGSATIFPDHVAYFDPDTRTAMNTRPPEDVMAIHGRVKEITDPDEQLAVFMQAMSMMPMSIKGKVDVALATQVDDQLFVLQSLPTLRTEAINLSAHLDTDRVGVFGMSIGGSAALLSCSVSEHCAAVANLDGFHPDQASLALEVPSMTLRRSDNLLVVENFKNAKADAYVLEVANTTHFNFFDFTIMSPLYKRLGVLGSIDGEEMVGISRDFLVAFFDRYLKVSESALLLESSEYPSENVTLGLRDPTK